MAPRTNKILIFIAKLAVSAAALYVVFMRVDLAEVGAMLRKIGIFYFLLAVSFYVLAQFLSSIRWKLLLPWKFGTRKLFSLYMIGAFFSSFLPGVVGGDAVRAYYLNKDAKKISVTLASVFMDRYLGYACLMTIGISAFPFAVGYFGKAGYRWLMPLIFVAFVCGSLLFFGLQLGRRFRAISEFYDYFADLKGRKGVIFKAFCLSFLIQFLNFLMVIVFAHAIGQNIPLLLLFVFLPIIITIATVPISISGLGLREGSFVLLLGLIGVSPAVATSLSLSWFFSLFVGSLPGLVAYIRRTGMSE